MYGRYLDYSRGRLGVFVHPTGTTHFTNENEIWIVDFRAKFTLIGNRP